MDATAVELVNDAWDLFGGQEPTTSPRASSAQARLDKARSQLGVEEQPANSNRTPYGAWYGMDGQPWCAMFCTWCDQTSSNESQALARGSRYAYVPYIVDDARHGRYGLAITSSPRPGDLVCYDWDGDGEFDHVGLFESGSGAAWQAIEGNTSTSDNSNGGQVMRRNRSRDEAAIVVFVHVAEP
jgi:hypothetical protein